MNFRKLVLCGLVTPLALALTTPAAAQDCWNGAAVKAAKVRDLQTILMIGALQCRATQYDVLGSYNTFIKTHRVAIAAHNDVLKTHFKRTGYARGYDRFTTGLANDRSADSIDPDFCKRTAELAGKLARSSRAEVEATAEQMHDKPKGVGKSCS